MKIGQFPFQAKSMVSSTSKIRGVVTVPIGSRVIHMGATPPKGEMFIWAEVPTIESRQTEEKEFVILGAGDEVPDGYVFSSVIVALPFLFVYERASATVLHS